MRLDFVIFLAATSVAVTGCLDRASAPEGPSGPTVSVSVAALELPSMSDACYSLTVWNHADPDDEAAEVVWTQPTLCASQYGVNGGIRFTGICDAQADGGTNAVRLVLNDVYASGDGASTPNGEALTAGVDYVNPCPAPEEGTEDNGCVRTAACEASQDTLVEFNLTVMRQAELGFFDTVVRFSDVFCAAKLDCVDQDDQTLSYLPHPDGGDGSTAVLGFTCLSSSGDPVEMYLDDLVVTCAGGTASRTATVSPSAGLGNLTNVNAASTDDILFGAAVHAGPAFQGARYWNVLLGLNLAATAGESCTLTTRGTASESALAYDGDAEHYVSPAASRYPYITWDIALFDDSGRTCARHPLNGDGDGAGAGVATIYSEIATSVTFSSRLDLPQALTCPCWDQTELDDTISGIMSGPLGTFFTGAGSMSGETGGSIAPRDPVSGQTDMGAGWSGGTASDGVTYECGSADFPDGLAIDEAEFDVCYAEFREIMGFDGPCPCWPIERVTDYVQQILDLGPTTYDSSLTSSGVGDDFVEEFHLWSGLADGDLRLTLMARFETGEGECGMQVSVREAGEWVTQPIVGIGGYIDEGEAQQCLTDLNGAAASVPAP